MLRKIVKISALFVSLVFISFNNIDLVNANTCDVTAPRQVRKGRPLTIEIEIPTTHPNAAVCESETANDPSTGCYQIRGCNSDWSGDGGCIQPPFFERSTFKVSEHYAGEEEIVPPETQDSLRKIKVTLPNGIDASLTYWLEREDENGNRHNSFCGDNEIIALDTSAECNSLSGETFFVAKKGADDADYLSHDDELEVLFNGRKVNHFYGGLLNSARYTLGVVEEDGDFHYLLNSGLVPDGSGHLFWQRTINGSTTVQDYLFRYPLPKLPIGEHLITIGDGAFFGHRYCSYRFTVGDGTYETTQGQDQSTVTLNAKQLCEKLPNPEGGIDGKCAQCIRKGGTWSALGCIPIGNITNFILGILGFAAGIAGGITFLLIVWGGFKYMLSRGNPEAIAESREIITNAIAGLLLILFSAILMRIIGVDILQLPGFGT